MVTVPFGLFLPSDSLINHQNNQPMTKITISDGPIFIDLIQFSSHSFVLCFSQYLFQSSSTENVLFIQSHVVPGEMWM